MWPLVIRFYLVAIASLGAFCVYQNEFTLASYCALAYGINLMCLSWAESTEE